jgi:hypothetical protein
MGETKHPQAHKVKRTKNIHFAGFKIRIFTSPLLPKSKAYFFSNKKDAKIFLEILQVLDRIIKSDKFIMVKAKPDRRIIRPN